MPLEVEQPLQTFGHTVNGRTFQARLEAGNYTPGNFATEAEARKWFDSESAVQAADMIYRLKIVYDD